MTDPAGTTPVGRDSRATREAGEAAWRPMAEAPRDGSPILAFNPMVGIYSTAFTTRWTGDPGEHAAGTYQGFPCGFWMLGLGSYPFGKWDCQPTAWRPMPDGPPTGLRDHTHAPDPTTPTNQ